MINLNKSITKILILVILIILVSSLVSASFWDLFRSKKIPAKTPTAPTTVPQKTIDYATYSALLEKHNKLVKKYNDQIQAINQCNVDSINIDIKWRNYLYKESRYKFYPTGCTSPQRTFTMCRSGCDIKYRCETNSMNPLFYCNAKLTLVECSSYIIGDIVLVENKGQEDPSYDFYIHQIVGTKGDKFITKGFNNYGVDIFDSTKSNIQGKVVKIEY